MAKPKDEPKRRTVAVVADDDLEEDIAAAKRATGIRNDSDLIRHAVRMLARGGAR